MNSTIYASDLLIVIASIAITIAGFSGVVVALSGRSTNSFDPVERLNLRILLQVSAFALLFSLVPLILQRALEADTVWRVSMFVYGSAHIFDAGYFVFRTRSSKAKYNAQKFAPIIGLLIAAYQLIIGSLGNIVLVEISYLIVLLWHLGIAGMGFVNLVFSSRDEPIS